MSDIDNKAIATIRLLAVDAVQAANSGHPGAPLGLAPAAHTLWKQMKFNPKNPDWINRDRFVLSNGHACALLYSLLHLYGIDVTLDDLKKFRSLDSKTPGHPERLHTKGVEVTTGPLGQGISNAVGLAIAGKQLASTYNKPDATLIDSYIYAFLGDGCLMEGVSSEASSIAGHLQLNNLIAFWDDNQISIDGDTKFAFTENVVERYKAYGWNVIEIPKVETGDLHILDKAIQDAKKVNDKPTLIRLVTIIGYGSLQQGTHGVHGAPLKPDDVKQLKQKFGFDSEKTFVVPQDVADFYEDESKRLSKYESEWQKKLDEYKKKYPKEGAEFQRRLDGKLPENWKDVLPTYKSSDKAIATRKTSELALSELYKAVPELIGGSADLTPSNLTRVEGSTDFQPPSLGIGNYTGRYIRYGVREHGMGAILNGISAYGANFKPYGGTFLNFVSYGAGAVRLASLSKSPVIWVATHDSIGLGEDGPTHQPIETLAHLRAIPNTSVWRPADGNETSAAYVSAIESVYTPHILALSRQNLPQLEGSSVEKALKGAYVVHEEKDANIIIAATGSEVSIAVDSVKKLAEAGFKARVVSVPDFFTFNKQPQSYRLSVFPDDIPILSVEVMSPFGWSDYSHEQFGLRRFGASAKAGDIYKSVDFTPEGIADRAAKTIEFYKGKKLLSPLNKAF